MSKNMLTIITVLVVVGLLLASPALSSTIDPFYRWDSLIKKYASRYNVPWRWVKAIMMNESDLGRARSVARGLENPSDVDGSKSSDGKSWGLMQLTLPTARMFNSVITEQGLNDPENSISIGVQYLAYIISKKGLNREAVVRSYNGGPGYNLSKAGQALTKIYYDRFLNNLQEINSLQPGDDLEVS